MTDIDILKNILVNNNRKYMLLKIFVDSNDDDLMAKYHKLVKNHNSKLLNNLNHIDAGFDLLSPETKRLTTMNVNKLDYKISCSAQMIDGNQSFNTCFYMYPRSSISKSNIRLANNVGIIDAGYRGHLMGMFDVIYVNETNVNKFDRHLQICAPGLVPIIVEIVSSKEELGEETTRGDGGFGSTGV